MNDNKNSTIYHTLEKFKNTSIFNLVEGLMTYFSVLRIIFQNFSSFPVKIDLHSQNSIEEFKKFAYFTTIIIFFSFIPIVLIHGTNIHEIVFITIYFIQRFSYGIYLYLGIKIIHKSNCSLKSTMIIYLYAISIILLLEIIIKYPLFLNDGLIAMIYNQLDIAHLIIELQQKGIFFKYMYTMIYAYVLSPLLMLFRLIIILSWISKIHKIRKWKVLCISVIINIFLSFLINLFPEADIIFLILVGYIVFIREVGFE